MTRRLTALFNCASQMPSLWKHTRRLTSRHSLTPSCHSMKPRTSPPASTFSNSFLTAHGMGSLLSLNTSLHSEQLNPTLLGWNSLWTPKPFPSFSSTPFPKPQNGKYSNPLLWILWNKANSPSTLWRHASLPKTPNYILPGIPSWQWRQSELEASNLQLTLQMPLLGVSTTSLRPTTAPIATLTRSGSLSWERVVLRSLYFAPIIFAIPRDRTPNLTRITVTTNHYTPYPMQHP